MGRKVVYAISDLQAPFEHQDAFDFVEHVVKTFRHKNDHEEFVNMGDEVDQHGLGKYTPDPNGLSNGHEILDAREHLKPWFKAYPKTKVCISNHTWRGYKRAMDAGIPEIFMRNIAEIYEAPPGWAWKLRWIIDGICYEHGESVSGQTAALMAAIQNRMSTVIGHQHSHGGVIHSATFHNSIFGLNTGCLIDADKYVFKYGEKLRKKPTLGMGVLVNRIPLFLPMVLNHKKRWIKRLI